jgi:hypothetical protein
MYDVIAKYRNMAFDAKKNTRERFQKLHARIQKKMPKKARAKRHSIRGSGVYEDFPFGWHEGMVRLPPPHSPNDEGAWYYRRSMKNPSPCMEGTHLAPGYKRFHPENYCVRDCEYWDPRREMAPDGTCRPIPKARKPRAKKARAPKSEAKAKAPKSEARAKTPYMMFTKHVWSVLKGTPQWANRPENMTSQEVMSGVGKILGDTWDRIKDFAADAEGTPADVMDDANNKEIFTNDAIEEIHEFLKN